MTDGNDPSFYVHVISFISVSYYLKARGKRPVFREKSFDKKWVNTKSSTLLFAKQFKARQKEVNFSQVMNLGCTMVQNITRIQTAVLGLLLVHSHRSLVHSLTSLTLLLVGQWMIGWLFILNYSEFFFILAHCVMVVRTTMMTVTTVTTMDIIMMLITKTMTVIMSRITMTMSSWLLMTIDYTK